MSDIHSINIRRLENGKWYWIEKAVIQQHAPKIGLAGVAVYNYLASLVGADQSCFPSQQHIADILGCSRMTVNKALKVLEECGLISVDKSGQYHHVYRLLAAGCKVSGPQLSKKQRSDVKHLDTNNTNITRFNNNIAADGDNSYRICRDFQPAIGNEPLAADIADALDDRKSLRLYMSYCRKYPSTLLRGILSEVKRVPSCKIRKSRAALFKHLVSRYEKQSTGSPGDKSGYQVRRNGGD